MTSIRSSSSAATTITSEHGQLPLAPIDRPTGWFMRSLFSAFRKRYGLTPTAFRVMYARSPFLAFVSLVLGLGLLRFVKIESGLRALLQISISMRTGCTFCTDLQLAEAIRAKLGRERFLDLLEFASSPSFTAREKAALAYSQALCESLHIPDPVWAQLAVHFSERERVDIVWVCAVERYFNSMAIPLRIGSDHLAEAS